MTAIGPMTFGPDGALFAADTQAATIYALELGDKANGGAPGTQGVDAIDQKIAALLGTDAKEIIVTDLVVHPRTKNAYVSVMRGQGTASKPALLRRRRRQDRGRLVREPQAYEGHAAERAERRHQPAARSAAAVDHRHGVQRRRLYIAGLSNEEFASKLRVGEIPFATADNGTSVEIFHGNHGQLETRSPVYAFLPYSINNSPHLVAALCTPLVKFPVASLQPGTKVVGTTIAELGNRNRPIDMVLYKKDGREFLLMSNTARGVMKIPTDGFANATPITQPVKTETGGTRTRPSRQ